jgi:D-alanyl-D-alanine carboxypeptidase
MNGVARKLGLRNTNFTNPHGLDYRNNYSCCKDILKLTLICF